MSEPRYADQDVADAVDAFEAIEKAREEGRRELARELVDALEATGENPGDPILDDDALRGGDIMAALDELAPGWREEER